MCDDHFHQRENTPDPLAEFFAQLLTDVPDVPPTPITYPTFPYPYPSVSTSIPIPAPYQAPEPHISCQWVLPNDPPLICGAPLSQDRKLACEHFRHAHDVRGNEKVRVHCHWHDCKVPPMLRGSLTRHILAVHLGILKWQCDVCGKMFSRKGTGHACVDDE